MLCFQKIIVKSNLHRRLVIIVLCRCAAFASVLRLLLSSICFRIHRVLKTYFLLPVISQLSLCFSKVRNVFAFAHARSILALQSLPRTSSWGSLSHLILNALLLRLAAVAPSMVMCVPARRHCISQRLHVNSSSMHFQQAAIQHQRQFEAHIFELPFCTSSQMLHRNASVFCLFVIVAALF